jgi:UDP-N-acetylglucosamine--N-acetylmuramyl-(pentapeptide) pyrophosphoryl-undecaprenol N-acetylglucosamine transferase
MTKTILITGTHLTPAQELIEQLQQDVTKWEIHYIGRNFTSAVEQIPTIESQLLPKIGVKFHPVSGGKLDRRYFPNTIAGIPQILKGLIQSFQIISRTKPDIVVSFGGYISVPVIISAFLHRIPSITHEQTLTISLSTKINSFFATKTALSFAETKKFLSLIHRTRIITTGNLLRFSLFNSESQLFQKLFGTPSLPLIYITAGNQGSVKINNLICQLLPQLTKTSIVIHQTGKLDFSKIKKQTQKLSNYYAAEYINSSDIGWIFKYASLIISRSGANTCQEIDLFNIPSIVIPLPVSQQDEQKKNAQWLQSRHADTTIIHDDLVITSDVLADSIHQLLNSINLTTRPAPTRNYQLLNLIHELV